MKLMKYVLICLFAVSSYTLFAHENTQLFIGQNANENEPAFVLELLDENMGDHFYVNEDGELYLKVDRIFSVSCGLANFAEDRIERNGFPVNGKSINELVTCSKCGHSYVARPGHRRCPRCGTSN